MPAPASSMPPLRIPGDWRFTPDQLTPIIAARHPGARLSAVRVLDGSDGTSSRARIGLDYAEGSGPAAVFAKTQGDVWHRLLHFMTGNLYREARLYASGVTIPVEHPAEYHGQVDRARLNELVIMEDLGARGAVYHDATRPMTAEQASKGLAGLARLHSAFWRFDSKSHPALAWVEDWRASRRFRIILRGTCGKGIANVRASVPDKVAKLGPAGLERLWTDYIDTVGTGPLTLLHGDAHAGNTYALPDGGFGFLDWACVRRGNWAFDLGYFMVGALAVEDRRRHERDLVEQYRQALDLPASERPSREEAWLRYRSSPGYGLPIWLGVSSSANYQSHPVCSAYAERYSAAFIDLDTPGAIAELSR